MHDDTRAAYQATVASLEKEIARHREEIAARQKLVDEALDTIRFLRKRIVVDVNERRTDGQQVEVEPERARKGEIKETVLSLIRSRPGMTGSEVADYVADRLTATTTTDKRKLAFSTISYLLKAGLVERNAEGQLLAITTQLEDSHMKEEDLPF